MNKRVSQKCCAIFAANCRSVECRAVISWRRWKQHSIPSAAEGAALLILFHDDVFWEHVVLVTCDDHDVRTTLLFNAEQEAPDLPQLFARHTVAKLDTHPDCCHSCHNAPSDVLGFCPNMYSKGQVHDSAKKTWKIEAGLLRRIPAWLTLPLDPRSRQPVADMGNHCPAGVCACDAQCRVKRHVHCGPMIMRSPCRPNPLLI